MNMQTPFAAALLDPARPCPDGLVTWNGSDPAKRFQVYRNNVIVSLVDALADTFAVAQQLVGEAFFRAMARLYACAHPPRSPVLALYGADFPAFIEGFPPAVGLPYLADVARLEYLRVRAYHAADASPVDPAALAALLMDESTLPALRLRLHPSLAVLPSDAAVVSLWAAHQGVGALEEVIPEVPETALILRQGLEVDVRQIPAAAGAFIATLGAGLPLGQAAAKATALDGGFDLAGALGLLLQNSAITALNPVLPQ